MNSFCQIVSNAEFWTHRAGNEGSFVHKNLQTSSVNGIQTHA